MPLTNSWVVAMTILWICFFLGALVQPMVTGVYMSKLDIADRPRAISLAYFTYNLLGYLPAPIIYGMANDLSS